MPIPNPPLPAGTKIQLSIIVTLEQDNPDTVRILAPDLNGGQNPILCPRTSIQDGTVIIG